jgi:hypothetical protein
MNLGSWISSCVLKAANRFLVTCVFFVICSISWDPKERIGSA